MNERATVESGLQPVDPLIGRVLDGRYRIERLLGEGGMGIVYKAVHTTLGKSLAIKVLRPEVSKNEEILLRFRQEAQSASQIGNPHIIDISDFGTLPDHSTYFVMEFLTGKSLTAALLESGGRFTVDRTIQIIRQLAGALAAAHEIGVVHRDLKPDNVQLIERGGQKDFVKVLDFGIAKVGGSTSKLTQAGQVFGTPHYMSPEQCAGSHVDQRTDIYAVGVMLYELASGRVPFDAENLMGILTKHLYENPLPPSQHTPRVELSPAFEAIILKCLQKKPEGRYQSMIELATDLDAVARGLPPKAVVEQVESAVAGPAAGLQPQTLTGVEARVALDSDGAELRLHKNKAPLYIAAGAVVAMLGIGGFWLFGHKNAQNPAQTQSDDGKAGVALPLPSTEPGNLPPTAAGPGQAAAPSAAVTEPPKPEPSAAAAQLTISSRPQRADVYVAGALVGHTPYALNKPEPGRTQVFELRAAGYEAKKIELTDSSTDVQVSLSEVTRAEPTRPVSARPAKRPAASEAAKSPKPEAKEAKPATPPAKSKPAPTEVLDPWN